MPTDTVIVLGAVAVAFVFFAAVLTYVDMTWDRSDPSSGPSSGT